MRLAVRETKGVNAGRGRQAQHSISETKPDRTDPQPTKTLNSTWSDHRHVIGDMQWYTHRMAPNLATSQLELIRNMIYSKSLTTSQLAEIADCGKRSIKSIRSNQRLFGTVRASSNGVGRPRSITSPMLEALCEHLLEKADSYQDETIVFLWNESGLLVTTSSIGRALASIVWSK